MLPSIRTFRNTDLAAVCKVWNAHFGDLGTSCQIDPLRLELCSLAKPYFQARDLLIAEYEEQVVGFLHLGPMANDQLTNAQPGSAAINALCVVPCDGEASVAAALLARAEQQLLEDAIASCQFKPMLPNGCFYLGLGPGDSMAGATTSERRVCDWIGKAGFVSCLPTNQWELDLADYQPPIDRVQIQIRRGCHVERLADEPALPWWQACLLGHTDPIQFRLTSRSDGELLCEALYWSVAAELQSVPESLLWLWPPQVPSEAQVADQIVFLLGEACRQLQAERVDTIRTVSAASDTRLNAILRRLQFKAIHNGVVFEKKLVSA